MLGSIPTIFTLAVLLTVRSLRPSLTNVSRYYEVAAKTPLIPLRSMSGFSAAAGGEGRGPSPRVGGDNSLVEPWRSRIDRSIAKSRKIRGGNYVQIATVDDQGLPACRTVVFRGFLETEDKSSIAMKMITDARSEKVTQIAANPGCEMVWWFSQTKEQYRLSGTLRLVGADESDAHLLAARKQQWGNLSDPAREQFYWHPPGEYSGESAVPAGGRDEDGKVMEVPDSFLLMLLYPSQVKFLRLTDNFAQKDVLESNGATWSESRINP
jgi:pyridoxamine 5'-phosphate oxidase